MPQYKHKITGEIISIVKSRVLFTEKGKIEIDPDGVYDLSEYDYVSHEGDFSNVTCKPNPRDKFF